MTLHTREMTMLTRPDLRPRLLVHRVALTALVYFLVILAMVDVAVQVLR